MDLADILTGAGGVGGNFGTMTPQEAAVAVTPGSVLDAIASHYATLPQRAFQASEDLRQGGDYDPAPAVEAASTMIGAAAPFAEEGAVGAAGGKLATPAIGGKAPLFDYSRLADVPDVPQFDLERYAPPRGVPEDTQALASKSNINRINKVVDQGAQMGGLEWYNTEPLRYAFLDELGPQGQQDYARYLDYVAASSPRSNVGTNARNASYYYMLDKQGAPLPDPDVAPLPQPYGHIAQRLHIQNADNIRDNGGIPVLQNPKPASFSQNLQGNQTPVTIDTHNARLIGLDRDLPRKNEYGFLEDMQQAQAAKKGMTPAQYQASAWIGAGEQTGLASSADPFVKVLEQRIQKTADARGLTPAEVLRQFIRGNAPLLSGAGVAGGAALDSQLGSVPDSP